MNNVKLLIAGSAFFAMSAQAADRVSIDVKVTLEAAACTPILSNGGVVNFGSHSFNRLSTQHYTQIGTRNINMTITCESATGIAITARDTRMDSMTTGKDSEGQSGVKYTLNGGGYISQTTRLFGLGKTKDNKNIEYTIDQVIRSYNDTGQYSQWCAKDENGELFAIVHQRKIVGKLKSWSFLLTHIFILLYINAI